MESRPVYYYTTKQGGVWAPFSPRESGFESVLMLQLLDPRRWSKNYKGKGPRTALSCIPGFVVVFVHSVKFPDGRIWDSHFRDFDSSTLGEHGAARG